MSRRAKYFFGDESFTSKAAVKKRASGIFSIYSGGMQIPEESSDYRFVEALLLNHIEARQKIGVGVSFFYVAKAPHHQTACFWLERIDGSRTDFGVPSCLDCPYQLNRASLRELVRPQIEAYRLKRLAATDQVLFTSDFSGRTFPVEEAAIDHHPPFDQQIERFFSNREEDPRSEMLTVPTDSSSLPVWRSPALANDFLAYHSECPLRLVHSRENLSAIKRIHNQQANPLI